MSFIVISVNDRTIGWNKKNAHPHNGAFSAKKERLLIEREWTSEPRCQRKEA